MRRYTSQVVMITGAAQGLGRAMAERFAAEGAQLAICDISESVKSTAAELAGDGSVEVTPTVVDVGDAQQVNQWAADTVLVFGQVDVLVNNAGVIRDSRLERMTDGEWDTVIAASLRGMFHCCRAVFGPLKDR